MVYRHDPQRFQELAWVYFDLWKEKLQAADWQGIKSVKEDLFKLPFYQSLMLETQVYWLVVKTVSLGIKKQQVPDCQALFEDLLALPQPKDGGVCTALLNMAMVIRPNWALFLSFCVWAKIEEIAAPEDLSKYGLAIAKSLLQKHDEGQVTFEWYNFLDWLEGIVDSQPTAIYARYYLVKIYLQMQEVDKAKTYVLDLVKAKTGEFWSWQLLAGCFEKNSEEYFAALAKALSLGAKEQIIVALRWQFAACLIEKDKWNHAKFEIEKILKTRNQEGWKIPTEIKDVMNHIDYHTAVCEKADYKKEGDRAEELLYEKLQTMQILISNIDLETKTAYYTAEHQKTGKIPLKVFDNFCIGQQYEAFFEMHPQKNYPIILKVKAADQPFDWVKIYKGTFKPTDRGFGFVGGVYIPAAVVAKNGLAANQHIEGIAQKEIDLKTNKQGWRAVNIQKVA